MSRRFKPEQISLINDLCQRLGFDLDSDVFKTDSGLLQLLPRIQARLNELHEEDTYVDVEEIATDTCPVVHPSQLLVNQQAYKNSRPSANFDLAVNSIMRSMISSQLRRAIAAVVIESSSDAFSTRMNSTPNCQQSSTMVEKSLSPLLTEIRSDTLLNEIVTSVVRAASETVHESESNLSCSRHSRQDYSASSSSVKTSKTKQKHRKAQTSHTSTASSKSSTSTSSFSGFPCFPSPHSPDESRANTWSEARSSSALNNASGSQTTLHKVHGAFQNRRNAMRHGVTAEAVAARLWKATSSHSCRRPLTNNSVSDAACSDDIVSNSNMEARWRNRTLPERRQVFCWPIEDAYRYPYDNADAVARDNWQFLNLRSPYCPAYAQLNRIRRMNILEERQQQRQLDAKNMIELDRGASSPFELHNGVAHPLGPSAAPCRAAFVGQGP